MARAKPKRTRRVIFTKILRRYRKETKLQSEVEIKVTPALLQYIGQVNRTMNVSVDGQHGSLHQSGPYLTSA